MPNKKKKPVPTQPASTKSKKPVVQAKAAKPVAAGPKAKGKSANPHAKEISKKTTAEESQLLNGSSPGSEDSDDMDDASFGGDSPDMSADALSKPGALEAAGTMKNFRHHPDMENFYRFIYENDLRFEALEILNRISEEKKLRKAQKATSKSK